MLSIREIEEFYQDIPPGLLEIVFELRNIICSIHPTVTEIIQWKGLSYFDSARGGAVSAGLCQIFVVYHSPTDDDHVQLAFIHGIFLPDPRGLLEGNAKYKRFVRIYSFEQAPWDALKELIQASSRFNPRTQTFK
jgi:hypothetical protein